MNNVSGNKPGFFKRSWWGFSCLIVFIIVVIILGNIKKSKEPSDSFGGITFLAKYKPGSSSEILNPPTKFTVFVSGSQTILFDQTKSPFFRETEYKIEYSKKRILIHDIDFEINENTANELWHEGPVEFEQIDIDSRNYKMGYDVPITVLVGVYTVRDNSIVDHYFELKSEYVLICFLVAILVPFIYILGVIVRFFYRRVVVKKAV